MLRRNVKDIPSRLALHEFLQFKSAITWASPCIFWLFLCSINELKNLISQRYYVQTNPFLRSTKHLLAYKHRTELHDDFAFAYKEISYTKCNKTHLGKLQYTIVQQNLPNPLCITQSIIQFPIIQSHTTTQSRMIYIQVHRNRRNFNYSRIRKRSNNLARRRPQKRNQHGMFDRCYLDAREFHRNCL